MQQKKYDLEQRTTEFGIKIIKLCQQIPKNEITKPIISQLIRSGTSIGANYCEADNAESKYDFKHKIGICKKESKETRYFLKIMSASCEDYQKQIEPLYQEALELNLIFNSIYKKIKSKNS
jgi:four helix bundle protein